MFSKIFGYKKTNQISEAEKTSNQYYMAAIANIFNSSLGKECLTWIIKTQIMEAQTNLDSIQELAYHQGKIDMIRTLVMWADFDFSVFMKDENGK